MGTGWERGNWVNSGWEYVDRGVLNGPVFLLHNYEWSTFGAALGPHTHPGTGLQETAKGCRTMREGDGKDIALVLATGE